MNIQKSEVLLDSVYTVEPLNPVYAGKEKEWDGHWNYQWSGRASNFNLNAFVKKRIEPDGSIIVKTQDGHIVRFFE